MPFTKASNTVKDNNQPIWQTGISYTAADLVKYALSNDLYLCISDHTSGTFLVDVASGYWEKIKKASYSGYTTTTDYIIADYDNYDQIFVNTSSGDATITLPLKANNRQRVITIMKVRGASNKVIISPNVSDANTLSNDGLTAIWLPKVGDSVTFVENSTSGYWEIVHERITSQLILNTYAGYGSTDTCIVRFTNSDANIGNMFSENHSTGYSSSAKGLEITINRSGRYSFSFSMPGQASNAYAGLSLNSSQLTTSIASITPSTRLAWAWNIAYTISSSQEHVSWTGFLSKNDVIRAHAWGSVIPVVAADAHITVSYLG